MTDRDRGVLAAMAQRGTEEWLRPSDIGGENSSHHAGTMAKLYYRGLAERANVGDGAVRPTFVYRLTQAGRDPRKAEAATVVASPVFPSVYHLIDPRDGKIFYVGFTTRKLNDRLLCHCAEARHVKNLWPALARVKAILLSDRRPIIEERERFASRAEGIAAEQKHIDLATRDGAVLLNRRGGGNNGTFCAESKAKMVAARALLLATTNFREKVSAGQKKKAVIHEESGRMYKSIREAAADLGLSPMAIGACVLGKRKYTKGQHFRGVSP